VNDSILNRFSKKLDNYYEKVHKNPTDSLIQDVSVTIENFEKILIAYMTDNNRRYNQKDVQRLIKEDLRYNILNKLQNMFQDGNFSRCDPYKI